MSEGPKPTFALGCRLFVAVLAAVYMVAFASAWHQAPGLFGPHGILPADQYFAAAKEQLGAKAWFYAPSICWIFGAGRFIAILCGGGLALSFLVIAGVAPAPCLLLLWASYLSIMTAGQVFFGYQWDALLLETTLVAVFVVPWTFRRQSWHYNPPLLGRLLVWWLLFRLMFLSGVGKLMSGDPTWRHLTALTFHYQTQPLPTPLAWYANQLPLWFQVASCAVMFAIELGSPLFLAAPRSLRHPAAAALIALQVVIALTGNFAFFNLLTIALCLTCFDDQAWAKLLRIDIPVAGSQVPPFKSVAVRWFAALAVGATSLEAAAALSPLAAQSPIVRDVAEAVGPLSSFNNYGLFRVMTVERPELIVEGSDDGEEWIPYELPFKPGDPAKGLSWVAPYQPRLDWQLWFAALEPSQMNPWVGTLCERILRGDQAVLALFAKNPFPHRPPRYVRVARYEYSFTDPAERERNGNWWRRTPIDFYVPPVSLTE